MYVRNGAVAHGQHNLSQLLHGPDADLWALIVKSVPVTWIRSHLTLEAALDQGFSRCDWLGNQAADVAAGCAARAHAVTAAQRTDRSARLQAAATMHRTIATVEDRQSCSWFCNRAAQEGQEAAAPENVPGQACCS